jgi:integrase
MIDTFKEYFGNPFLVEIDYASIRKYKEWMLETPYKVRLRIKLEENEVWDGEIFVRHKQRFKIVEEERERTPATVHRYLSKLRRIFSVGVQEGLLAINPFKQGDTLIETSIEVTRDRICSYEEEDAIYSVCTGQRAHLADVVTIAIDTFVRENELFSLLGSDINFDSRFLNVREMNSKTSQTRTVPLSDRALAAFKRLRGNRPTDEWNRSRVFDIKSVGSSWYTALKKTGIEDLRIHDLRGTGITRMLDASVPVPVVMKYSGHKKYETFMKYVKKDLRMIQNAADAINLLHRQRQNEIARANLALDNNAEKPASELETIEINVEQ